MSLRYANSAAPRTNYFSSPTLFINGLATGDASNDNRRAHLERKAAMAAQGAENGTCPGPARCWDIFGWFMCLVNGWWCCWMGACFGLCRLTCGQC